VHIEHEWNNVHYDWMMSDAAGEDRDGCQAINHISMLEMIESCKFLEETALIRAQQVLFYQFKNN